MSKKAPARVAVTGAGGQICYSLLFRIAAGDMLGTDQPVILQLLDIPQSLAALGGVAMELEDCAFPLLEGFSVSDDPKVAFRDADFALLVGARPRGKGMERNDLLQANAEIFSVQGRALNEVAKREVKVAVVGNPANTNALIAQQNAPDIPPENFSAMMRLDHNRARAQAAKKLNQPVSAVSRISIWGNHSSTQYPDLSHALCAGEPIMKMIEEKWVKEEFIPTVQQRGAAVIAARGSSSAASAANALLDHMRDWVFGTPKEDWVSMAVMASAYGVGEGVFYGYPVTCESGRWRIVEGLDVDAFSREHMRATFEELLEERRAVEHLFPR